MVEVVNPETGETINYHIDKKLIKYLDGVKEKLDKKDKDHVLVMDGYEGSGKSTLAGQMGKYVDPSLNLDRICMTANEFKQAIIKAEKKQCVIYDEAVTGMSSSDSITRIGKLLKSMMMQMRQKNLFVIVIIPSLFELNKYTILSRCMGFFHTYESNGRMGYWVGYNKKDTRMLYLKGKKTYSYKTRSYFIGRFYGKYVVDEEEYRKKKADALFELDEEEVDPRYEQRNLLLWILHKELKLSAVNLEKLVKSYGLTLKRSSIQQILTKVKRQRERKTKN